MLRSRLLRSRLIAATGIVVALVAMPSTAQAAGPVPSSDPFYTYNGSLASKAPGEVLNTRTVTIQVAGAVPAMSATQVLYRTVDQMGAPDATVATIIKPLAPIGSTKIVSYQSFYDGLNGICRPSYTLQQQTSSPSGTAAASQAAMLEWVAAGYTVVTADYEGSTDNFGAGTQSGEQTLDGIRAAEQALSLNATTPVALEGYSGGSIASMWAAELQKTYAPELNIVGVAAAGIPPDFAHNLPYIDGSTGWAGALPAVGLGLFRAFHVDPNEYLSPKGLELFAQQAQGCLDQGGQPGLRFEDMLKPQYKNWQQVPVFVDIFNSLIMGRTNTPSFPLLMGVGNSDGTGDGVMVAKDVQQLAYEYCQRGVNVNYTEYTHLDHTQAIAPFIATATTFLTQVLNGLPVTSNCSSITPGNPLTPLTLAAQANGSGGTPGSTSAPASGAGSAGTGQELTGVDSGLAGDSTTPTLLALGSAGTALLALGCVAVARRRWNRG